MLGEVLLSSKVPFATPKPTKQNTWLFLQTLGGMKLKHQKLTCSSGSRKFAVCVFIPQNEIRRFCAYGS